MMRYSRRDFLTTGLAGAVTLTATSLLAKRSDAKPNVNVLFIGVDDLRPQLGCYGQDQIKSPNIDRLAARGLLFERTYCQQAVCMASRASLMSGYRPDKGKIYSNGPLFRHVPDAVTINQHFMNNGYETVSMGKIYHHSSDYKKGWSREAFQPKGKWKGRGYLSEEAIRLVQEYTAQHPNAKRQGLGPAFESPDIPDSAYPDGLIAEHAIKELNRLQDKPFFIAVGFYKPHLPFNAPKKYWNLYPEKQIRLADNPLTPKGAPKEALTDWGELRSYHGMPRKGPMPDDLARTLIRGYYACISYTDAMIGNVLNELDRLELRNNTIVALWGDHGWKLGELGMWAKHTNFELDTHVPMIISAPGMNSSGKRTRALTEFVDIYPTLCELCGLEQPKHLEGTSMVPLLNNPDQPWKKAAFSQFPKGQTMGYSMRTDKHRYTEWRDLKSSTVKARELYDHQKDPRENTNIARDIENQELITTLAKMLNDGYRAAQP